MLLSLLYVCIMSKLHFQLLPIIDVDSFTNVRNNSDHDVLEKHKN